ncbi:NADPH-dependent FMN reductase [Paraburkholderia adhaesiva]|uniref:NADPH-dependent FMN reductase n=1 Tax=Paraburkholderia adhaesiva TaxID=2883244 RepID=UPI001F2286E1|nr:NADPH-dependent FMN reductase [Paraburkholderia adhaesiva]
MTIIAISGSPSPTSRTQRLLSHLLSLLEHDGRETRLLSLSSLPGDAVIRADVTTPEIARALANIDKASVVIVGTPIYKATYSGLLKVFLDLLPQRGLDGKIVLPIATGGSEAHLLALDYALRPVLQSLGADIVLPPVYALDRDIIWNADGHVTLDDPLRARVHGASQQIGTLVERLYARSYTAASGMCVEPAAQIAA